MSGGSLDYAYSKIEDLAERIEQRSDATHLHKAFAKHLKVVAGAAYELEWMYSGDTGPGGEIASIKLALGEKADALELICVKNELSALVEKAKEILKRK